MLQTQTLPAPGNRSSDLMEKSKGQRQFENAKDFIE